MTEKQYFMLPKKTNYTVVGVQIDDSCLFPSKVDVHINTSAMFRSANIDVETSDREPQQPDSSASLISQRQSGR